QALHRAVQDVAVRGPLDPVAEQRDRDHQQPLPTRVVDPVPAEPHRSSRYEQRKAEMERAVIPLRCLCDESLAELTLTLLLPAVAAGILEYHVHRSLPCHRMPAGIAGFR